MAELFNELSKKYPRHRVKMTSFYNASSTINCVTLRGNILELRNIIGIEYNYSNNTFLEKIKIDFHADNEELIWVYPPQNGKGLPNIKDGFIR